VLVGSAIVVDVVLGLLVVLVVVLLVVLVGELVVDVVELVVVLSGNRGTSRSQSHDVPAKISAESTTPAAKNTVAVIA